MKGQLRVIIDTNIWISYLIGFQLRKLDQLLKEEKIRLIFSKTLLQELIRVSSREKFRRYFSIEDVDNLISLIRLLSDFVEINHVEQLSRDPKDDFLIAMAHVSMADYLVTGDEDLLVLKVVGSTRIVTPQELMRLI